MTATRMRRGGTALLASAGAVAVAVAGTACFNFGTVSSGSSGGADGGGGETDGGDLSCAHYCAVIMQNCTGANAEYLSSDVCAAMCPAFEVNDTIADTADDTLGCRIFHAMAAATTPDVSCRVAGPLGGGHCGNDPCEPFCTLDVQYCAPPNPVAYDGGASACDMMCRTYPYLVADAGDTTLEGTNTLNCRLWHLETAFRGPTYGAFHCPHTAQASETCN